MSLEVVYLSQMAGILGQEGLQVLSTLGAEREGYDVGQGVEIAQRTLRLVVTSINRGGILVDLEHLLVEHETLAQVVLDVLYLSQVDQNGRHV